MLWSKAQPGDFLLGIQGEANHYRRRLAACRKIGIQGAGRVAGMCTAVDGQQQRHNDECLQMDVYAHGVSRK